MPIPNYASATFAAQAEPDSVDFDIFSAGQASNGVSSGCACTPNASGSTLVVAVAAGFIISTGLIVAVSGTTVTPGAAHATLNRFDLVTVNTAGVVSIVAGTAAATPVFPTTTNVVLASVYIPATATSITSGNIIDKRVFRNLGLEPVKLAGYSSAAPVIAINDQDDFIVPSEMNLWIPYTAVGYLCTAGTTTTTIQVFNVRAAANILSSAISLTTGLTSAAGTVGSAALNTGDRLRVDISAAGTGALGWRVVLQFMQP